MPSHEHIQILERLSLLSQLPTDEASYSLWMKGEGYLQLLENDLETGEIILFASSYFRDAVTRSTFINGELTNTNDVTPPDPNDLMDWHSDPFSGRAAFVWRPSKPDEVRVESDQSPSRPSSMEHRQKIVFERHMEGLNDEEATYYELLQEFAHASDIYWRQEQKAFCRIDENGDIEPVVSVTKGTDSMPTTLITCNRQVLEQYLAATDSVLIRFFDLMMFKQGEFTSWDEAVREEYTGPEEIFSYRDVHPKGHSWTRGAQIFRPTTSRQELFRSFADPRHQEEKQEYVSFIIHDWRNDEIVEVTTKPGDTTNYFQAKDNSLPFELSPAFFRPEVLSKYKADRDKYTIDESSRFISCRGAWYLRGFDVNEAGQVHAYICYLRNLPYQEQLHWKAHNERPKGTISERAIDNDIKGAWSFHVKPLERALAILQEWNRKKTEWWRIHDEGLFHRVNTPVSSSREEWAQAFQDLTIVVIEGFQLKALKALLERREIPFGKEDRSLTLLEKLLNAPREITEEEIKLNGLRQVQRVRTLARSHGGGSEGENMRREALNAFGTYRKHFEHICGIVADELEMIESHLTKSPEESEPQT